MDSKRRAQIVNQNGEIVDRISSLPDDVLSHILSLMPTKFAVRTSILSNRWRYIWTSVTNLDFDNNVIAYGPTRLNLASFVAFVNRVLRLCNSPRVQLFRLRCADSVDSGLTVEKWIIEAIRLDACEIVIEVPGHTVPLSLFTCENLKILKLDSMSSEIPSSVCLPNLKILSLSNVAGDLLQMFIYGCPMLEDLSFMGKIIIFDQKDYVLNITSLTMKRLKIMPWPLRQRTEIVVNTPNLEYLNIRSILNFRLEKLQSLVEASIGLEYNPSILELISSLLEDQAEIWESEDKINRVIERLQEISGVKSLSLHFGDEQIRVLEFLDDDQLPMFHNLTHLEMVFTKCQNCKFLPRFLKSSPSLEHLSLEKKYCCGYSEFHLQFLSCNSLLHLVKIKLKGFEGTTNDYPLVEYLLSNAKALELLVVVCTNSTLQQERMFYDKLLKLSKAARNYKIDFHGFHLQIPSSQETGVF